MRFQEPSTNQFHTLIKELNLHVLGYEWVENRFPEYDQVVCPRCQRRQIERVRRNLVQSSTSAKPLRSSTQESQIDEIMELLNFGTIDPMVQ